MALIRWIYALFLLSVRVTAQAQSSLSPLVVEFGLFSDVASPETFKLDYTRPAGCNKGHLIINLSDGIKQRPPIPLGTPTVGIPFNVHADANSTNSSVVWIRASVFEHGTKSMTVSHWCQEPEFVSNEVFQITTELSSARQFVLVLLWIGIIVSVFMIIKHSK